LMKENLEFLLLLKDKNPQVNIRVNTNLSKVDTKIFDLVCQFSNVHWIVSIESIEEQYEYIRYGGNWQNFVENLQHIKNLDHKISFNMLYFLLNFKSIFSCIDYLKQNNFHNNSFIIGPVTDPAYFDVRNLPDNKLSQARFAIQHYINQRPGFLLENSLNNILQHLDLPFQKNIEESYHQIKILDQSRKLDSSKIFEDLYE